VRQLQPFHGGLDYIQPIFRLQPELDVTAGSAATPERIDRVANAIVEASAPLIDDFEMARTAARAAIEAIAS
jgi:hypothetical protein